MLTKTFSTIIKRPLRTFAKFQKFDYTDPLNFQSLLTDDELMIMETAEKFSQKVLMPGVQMHNRNETFDASIYKEMGQVGLIGCTLPDYDCMGASSVGYGLINRAIERVDSSYRSCLSVQSSLVIHPIHTFGSQAQKDKYLPDLIAGEKIGCFGLTEPDYGSNPSGMVSRAVKKGNKYILNGSKTWITSSPIADIAVVWAKDDNNDIRGFILERGMPGFTTPKIEGKMSLRASCTGMIMMDDVEVPEENILPNVKGLTGPFSCLNNARFGISWGVMGAAEDCFYRAREYMMERKMFDAPIAAYQIPQLKMANMVQEISLGMLACVHLSRLKDEGKLATEMISVMKRNNCVKALDIARNARDMLGGNGIVDEYHIIRHMVNLETVNTYEGTQDIHALIVGRGVTGHQAFTRGL